jgi:outer membrane protein TolC
MTQELAGKMIVRCAVVAVMLLGSGCALLSPRPSFRAVSEDVTQRTGYAIEWEDETIDKEGVEAKVQGMLSDGQLTREEAVEIALLYNPRLQATYEELGISRAAVVQAWLPENPVFDGAYLDVRHAGHVIEMEVAQDFLSLLMIPLRTRLANTQMEITKKAVTGAVMDMINDVAVAYYRLQADRQTVEMLRVVLRAAEASSEMARRLREAGNITRLEVYNRRALYEEIKIAIAAAEARVVSDREHLNALLGLWGKKTQWEPSGSLPALPEQSLDLSSLERRVIENSIDLAVARKSMEATARGLNIKNITSVLPELEVGVDSEREENGTWLVGPMLALPVPLFDQGFPARAAARAQLRRAWDRYTALAIEIRSAARAARYRYLTARNQANYYDEVIAPLRAKITHQTQLRYNGMLVSPFDLLEAKQAEIEAKRRGIEALRDYWIARTELETILRGRLVDGSSVALSAGANAAARMSGNGGH